MSHHAVHKDDSTTTKTRVVFNASMPTSSGVSLNNVLKVGPVVQRDLFSILIKFRKHDFVLIGDLAKMYRQILIQEDQRVLQQIVWRSSPDDDLGLYQLNTITYGTASASFLATRCLNQIAYDLEKSHPIESKIILEDFYVDDLLTGSNDLDQLINIGKSLIQILAGYGFNLRKFKSNELSLLNSFNSSSGTGQEDNYILDNSETSKTLGIAWQSRSDTFCFNSVPTRFTGQRWNKRLILSYTSQQFDPLGLITPITLPFKLFMQSLWQAKINWDESLPQRLHSQWIGLLQEMEKVQEISIPRHAYIKGAIWSEMHVFADASEKAYGAAIYIISSDSLNGNITTKLLTSKSRVAPLKIISLPRLELCAALLASKLSIKTAEILNIGSHSIFYYSDSTIVLAWLQKEPNLLPTFIANRTSEISQITELDNWFHVASAENPADLLTRGISFEKLHSSELWWRGPAFLKSRIKMKRLDVSALNIELPEVKKNVFNAIQTPKNNWSVIDKFSSLNKLIRVIAYCERFTDNIKSKIKGNKLNFKQNLEPKELETSELILLRSVQGECFAKEIKALNGNVRISPSSSVSKLDPFLDKDMIMRVGGRLKYAIIPYDSQHPILLPNGHTFTKLVIENEHKRSLHAGVNATLAFVRQKFWPIRGKTNVKSVIRKCVSCYRIKPVPMRQQMSHLPSVRVNATRVFGNCGIDFAGPFEIKDSKTRNKKILKGYMCLFICLWSKACHIEAVTELTNEAFLATLKRFVSRRGLPRQLWSDNGTNFVGAYAILNQTFKNLLSSPEIANFFGHNKIEWKFIPPRSPHFGGIWEAAIKSAKTLLKRTLQNQSLHYEEFVTILCQVEASLNSRPLFALPETPNDPIALTPGHFIIGDSLTALPEEWVVNQPINYVKRFKMLQSLQQRFWKQWQKEYLHQLQERNKWKFKINHPELIGKVVLIKEDNYPPLQWLLGRIQEVHPSEDGLVRVVTLKTKNGIFKRAVHKLCILPMNEEFESELVEKIDVSN